MQCICYATEAVTVIAVSFNFSKTKMISKGKKIQGNKPDYNFIAYKDIKRLFG
jgi:hypothetical protein